MKMLLVLMRLNLLRLFKDYLVGQLNDDWEMIRGSMCPIFSWDIGWYTIGICQNTITERCKSRCYENMVYPSERFYIRVKPIFSTGGCQSDG